MLLNAILGVKAQKHEKCFFLMKWNVFCNAEDRFSWVWDFLAEKVILELNCTNHFFIASKNTNSVFSANDEVASHGCSKTSSLSEKKLLNAILRVKAQNMKSFFLMKWNVFCNAEDRFSWVWGF